MSHIIYASTLLTFIAFEIIFIHRQTKNIRLNIIILTPHLFERIAIILEKYIRVVK